MFKRLTDILRRYSTPQRYYLENSLKVFSKKCGPVSLFIDIGCGYSPYEQRFSAKSPFFLSVRIPLVKRAFVEIMGFPQAIASSNVIGKPS